MVFLNDLFLCAWMFGFLGALERRESQYGFSIMLFLFLGGDLLVAVRLCMGVSLMVFDVSC